MINERTTWKIRVSGYGTFDFEGTEAEAEQKRRDKCQWEHATGLKWRSDLARDQLVQGVTSGS